MFKKRKPSFTASAKGKKVEVNSHYNTHSLFLFKYSDFKSQSIPLGK